MRLLTVCIPVFNEGDFIDKVVSSIVDAQPIDKEIIFIDAGCTDETINKIKGWRKKYLNIRIIENKFMYVSHGFNLAFKQSQSKYITLMGAHSEYPPNYFEVGLSLLENDIADAVGGPLKQVGKTKKGSVIASCMSSKFGVGDTSFRTSKKRGYVQSVPMAIYKRKIFEKVGLLDADLKRNQDDEFHYRLYANEYKIFMEPAMETTYFVREDFRSLWQQYFNYGLYKPLVFKKVRSGLRLRHLVPSIFVIYLILIPMLIFLNLLTILPLCIYLIFCFFISYKLFKKPGHTFWGIITFCILHISYGFGAILGLRKLF